MLPEVEAMANSMTIDRTTTIRRSRKLEFIGLYAMTATIALLLTTKFALFMGWGQVTETGWVDLDGFGGLFLGAIQGLLQYAVLRLRHRVSVLWVAVTGLAWAIAMGLDGLGSGFLQGLSSPIALGLAGLGQWLLLPRKHLRQRWGRVVVSQLLWVALLQVLALGFLLGTVVVALATWGQATAILAVLHGGAIGLYHGQLLAHGLIPAIGLYGLWRND
jgi:hypothetical protein